MIRKRDLLDKLNRLIEKVSFLEYIHNNPPIENGSLVWYRKIQYVVVGHKITDGMLKYTITRGNNRIDVWSHEIKLATYE